MVFALFVVGGFSLNAYRVCAIENGDNNRLSESNKVYYRFIFNLSIGF